MDKGLAEKELERRLAGLRPVCRDRRIEAKAVWDGVFKPIDGLGRLEDMLCDIAAIQDSTQLVLRKRAILVLCSDNGIVQEGVAQSSPEVTRIVAENMAAGRASINRMAACCQADVIAVDIGMKEKAEGCLDRSIGCGTGNFAIEPAMSREEAAQAVLAGIELVGSCREQGYRLLGTGEMGIGNTTTTSALTSLLLRRPPEEVTGPGAGLSEEGLSRKCAAIKKGLRLHFGGRGTGEEPDVLAMLSCVGGYDIAGLTGVFLGGGLYRIPVIIDGVISACAALLAKRLRGCAAGYMLASHLGREPAHGYLLNELGLKPVIHGELALGEGTGAVLLMPMLDMALAVYENKETFEENKLAAYQRFQ